MIKTPIHTHFNKHLLFVVSSRSALFFNLYLLSFSMSLVHILALLLTIQGSLATSDSLSWTGWYKESSSITEISTFSFSSNRKSPDSDAQKGGKEDDIPLGYFVLESSILPASNSSFLYAGNNNSSSNSGNSLLLLMCPLDFWLNVVKMPISAPSTCILDTPYRRKLYQSCPIVQWMSEFVDPSSSPSNTNSSSSSSSGGGNSTIHSNNSTGNSTKRRFQKRQYPSDDFFNIDNNYDDDAWDDDGIDNLYNTFEYLKMFVIYENDTVSQPTRIRNLIDKVYAKADTFYIFAIAYCGQEKFLASSPARRSSSSSSKSTSTTHAASNASLLLNSIDVTLTVRRLVSLELGHSYTIDEHRGTEVVNTGSLYESSEFASFEYKILSIYRAAVIAGIVLFLASVAFYLSFLVREKWRNPGRSLFSLIAVQFSNSISLLALLTINNLITLVIVSEYESSNHSLFDSRNLSFSRQSTLFYPEQPNRSFLLVRDSLDWILSSILIYLVPSLFFKYVPIYRSLTSLSPGEWRSISGASASVLLTIIMNHPFNLLNYRCLLHGLRSCVWETTFG